jgi:hypothetical protein
VLILFAGIELAMCARDMNSKEDYFVALICTAVSLVGSSAALGFLVGTIVYELLKLRIWSNDKTFSTIWTRKVQTKFEEREFIMCKNCRCK